MPRRYAEIYPSLPLLNSDETEHMSAAALMSVRYFQAEPNGTEMSNRHGQKRADQSVKMIPD